MLTIQSILEVHNELEEQDGGLYKLLEDMVGPEMEQILAQFKSAPPVAVFEAAKKAVTRAGHEFKAAL
jgi:hypothetical protein